MNRIGVLILCVAVSGASFADAGVIVGSVRTPYNDSLDRIDFHITALTGADAGGLVNGIGGTWSAMESDAYLTMSCNSSSWTDSTSLNSSFQAPSAPYSFVNFERDAGDVTRTGGLGGGWQTWSGSYYTTEPAVFLGPVDPDLTDGFDQTLLATIYVTKGKNVRFAGFGGGAIPASAMNFDSTPEPGMLVMLASGAVGLFAFAWRRWSRPRS